MAHSLKLRKRAVIDIGEAYEWYEEQKMGLVEEFLLSAEDAFQSITENPKGYGEKYPDIRKCNLRKFPYAVYYRIFNKWVSVLAVYHQSRKPSSWQKRK